MSDIYRSAASVLVLKPVPDSADGYHILLLHKPRKNDAWQLPQGGVEEGENTLQAATRELMEEASINNCTVLGESVCVYQYEFPQSFRRFRPDNVRGQRICFILATVPADVQLKVDNKEIDKAVWVPLSDVPTYIQRQEYRDLITKLYEEAMERMRGSE